MVLSCAQMNGQMNGPLIYKAYRLTEVELSLGVQGLSILKYSIFH